LRETRETQIEKRFCNICIANDYKYTEATAVIYTYLDKKVAVSWNLLGLTKSKPQRTISVDHGLLVLYRSRMNNILGWSL